MPQQQQQRPMNDNRWSNYSHMGQGQGHAQQQQQVYNPLNPMAGRYQQPQQGQGSSQYTQYKNPMMGQRAPPPPAPQGGQYYDGRYQGYQQ